MDVILLARHKAMNVDDAVGMLGGSCTDFASGGAQWSKNSMLVLEIDWQL